MQQKGTIERWHLLPKGGSMEPATALALPWKISMARQRWPPSNCRI